MTPDNQLTEKDKVAYSAIAGFIRENGYAPSVRDLCRVLGVKSTATIQFRLKSLAEKGYIKTTAGGKRTIRITRGIEETPTVDAKRYMELVEMYNDLREGFVDYVCSGIPNVAPYCINICKECVDLRGWCKSNSDKCRGFNPAKVIHYGGGEENETE